MPVTDRTSVNASTGQAIAASAELLTAEICRATGGVPAPVCGGAAVQDYSKRLGRFGGRGSGCVVAATISRRLSGSDLSRLGSE